MWCLAAEPPDRPGLCLWIERAERRGSDLAIGETEDVVLHISEPAQNLLRRRSTFELEPIRAATQTRFETTMANEPVTDHEIEI